jgi:hypothetical protein
LTNKNHSIFFQAQYQSRPSLILSSPNLYSCSIVPFLIMLGGQNYFCNCCHLSPKLVQNVDSTVMYCNSTLVVDTTALTTRSFCCSERAPPIAAAVQQQQWQHGNSDQLGGGSRSATSAVACGAAISAAAAAAWLRWAAQQQLGGSCGNGSSAAASTTVLLPRAIAVGTKTPAATVVAVAKITINNQLKAGAAQRGQRSWCGGEKK